MPIFADFSPRYGVTLGPYIGSIRVCKGCMIDDLSFSNTLDSSDQLSGGEMLDFTFDIRERIFASTLWVSYSPCLTV